MQDKGLIRADLEKYIKMCNLCFTRTLNSEDFCRVGFDLNRIKINKHQCKSLYQIISSFNQMYLQFKKE